MDMKLEVVLRPVSDVDRAKQFHGLQLVVADVDAARKELLSHGVEASEVFHDATGVFHHAGNGARVPGAAPDHKSYASFFSFSDPDGNGWYVQEITTRLPGR